MVLIFGKRIPIPRQQVGYGETGTFYRFSGVQLNARPWHPILKKVCDWFSQKYKVPLNFVLVNKYKNGHDYIGWHADDEADLKHKNIVSLSLGATRRFLLRQKRDHTVKVEYVLGDNDVVVMREPTNAQWQHHVPKMRRVTTPRWNLTFRYVVPAATSSSSR